MWPHGPLPEALTEFAGDGRRRTINGNVEGCRRSGGNISGLTR
jgi:hypothetical protein